MALHILQNQSLTLTTGLQDINVIDITTLIEHEPLLSDPVNNSYFLTLMWTNFIVGFFYRILVFRQIRKTGGLFGGRPINILTGIFEISHFYCIYFHSFQTS